MESRKSIGSKSMKELGSVNAGFEADESKLSSSVIGDDVKKLSINGKDGLVEDPDAQERAQWSRPIEFLMSCIAMSVGLGNVWRFPFTAFDNGGGAFLIPYIIVLFIVGRPMYMMEMGMGQFSSYSAVKIWRVVPALKGIGWAMTYVTAANLTYYCSLMAITIFYFIASFRAELPWSVCNPEWGPTCFDSKNPNPSNNYTGMKSSSELYFVKEVLKEKPYIDDGIGYPEWRLTLCLLVSWITIFLVIVKGVRSSGKASYFLALFPYVVLTALLIRGVTLPGSGKGILFFITPQWEELLNAKVWYAAVTQAFFSLSVSFGSLIMYSSYNNFSHTIYRDSMIVTTLDTFTSLLAGCTIFAILGNLAHEMGVDDIREVIKGDMGLAFISYPDAIAKFEWAPQFFSVLFFLMLYTLGIGSSAAMSNSVISAICDQFRSLKYWMVALVVCILGFLSGLVYVTPGGQWIQTLVDFYCITFVVYIIAVVEITGIAWVYGFNKFCRDLKFMLDRNMGIYWRICWGILTPIFLIVIFLYTVSTMEPKQYDNKDFPPIAYTIAWILAGVGMIQIPIWMGVEWIKNRDKPFMEMVTSSFRPSEKWGPKDPKTKLAWQEFRQRKSKEDREKGGGLWRRTWRKFTGFEETD